MGLGVSIFLIAVGAVLAFAIHVATNGVDLHTIGWILMGAGALGIVLSLIFWSSWGGPGVVRRDTTTIDDRPL
jgi:Na+/proline symporter